MEGGDWLTMPANYPNISSLSGDAGISEFMALPNASDPWYWTIMMVGLWIIFSLSMYFKEKSLLARGNLLSSMAVSAVAVILLGLIGTLFNILTLTTYLPLLVGGMVIIAIWMFSS